MTQYTEDWSGSTLSAEPTGWTKRWVTANTTYTVQSDSEGPGGRRLRIGKSATERGLISLDAVDSDTDRETFEMRALVRVAFTGSPTTDSYLGLCGRASGTATNESGEVGVQGYEGGTNTSGLRWITYNSGSATLDDVSVSWTNGDTYWLTLTVSGTSRTVGIAAAATPNTTIGSISEPTSISADGWIGLFTFSSNHSPVLDVLWTSIGTDVDNAPYPVATLSSPTGTQTGQTTADGSVSTTVGHGTLFAVVTQSATSPSATQVKAGQDHTGSAADFAVGSGSGQTVSSVSTQNVSATGLTSNTTYFWHFVHDNEDNVSSSVSTSSSFTTSSSSTKGVTVTLYDGTTLQTSITGITAQWWDSTTPSGAPVSETTTASTDASGVLTLDIDADTSLTIGQSGYLKLWKYDSGTPVDSLGWQGILEVEGI